MNYSVLLEQVENFVITENLAKLPDELLYHNGKHTGLVVKRAAELGRYYSLTDQDFFIGVSAAWFHDCGYSNGSASGHEERGAKIAANFLQDLGVKPPVVAAVESCILATRIPQSPKNLLESILCDADLYDLGTEEFLDNNKLLRKEKELEKGKKIDKTEWRIKTIRFLEAHHYQTDFCRDLLEARKQEHIQKLKKKVAKEQLSGADSNAVRTDKNTEEQPGFRGPEPDDQLATSGKKAKNDRPDKGIETMFRISSGNHQRLSDMADNKANIMITTNSIIISVLLSMLLRKLEDNPNLIVPTLMLLTVCVTTMVFSILSTRPSVPRGTFSATDISERKVNLLFFGNFYRMSYEDYAAGMQEMMNDRSFLYGSLIKDVYSQGIILGKKYRLLRTGYNIFMFGIVASVVAFVISSIFFEG